MNILKKKSKLFYFYIITLVVYSAFVLIPKPLPATLVQYHVSALGLRLIYVTIILILAGIWYAGFYGFRRMQTYSYLIKGDVDGQQLARFKSGLLILSLWLPITTTLSTILNYFDLKQPGLVPAYTIIENYINLIIPLAGFSYISLGARGLTEIINKRPSYKATNLMFIVLIAASLIYYHLVATTHNRGEVYHMSIWFIMFSLALPYIYMWSIGLLAAYEIYIYSSKVKGIIYRKSWHLLDIGLSWLILVSIAFQYLSNVFYDLDHLSIYVILLIIYSVLLVLAIGFMLVALGTKKLQKIEEV